MPATREWAASTIAIGHAAGILLLSAPVCQPAAAQTFEPTVSLAHLPPSPGVTADSRGPAIPANLVVPDVLRPLTMTMWRRSPTFRRQCVRLSAEPDIVVRVQLTLRIEEGWARVAVKRHGGGRVADVQLSLRRPEHYAEDIAHEIEHVLEVLDRVDLAHLARQQVDGVKSDGGAYETVRAQSVGRTVAREVLHR